MNHLKKTSENGSALLVTIMITSVVLIFAMILLERIIPYSRQIRGMQDSLQAYYTAQSELELAKREFQKKVVRTDLDPSNRILTSTGRAIRLGVPIINTTNTGDYVVVSNSSELPLQINMFENDATPRGFGTSQKDPNYHALAEYGGGMLFDLSDINTNGFSMITSTDPANSSSVGNIQVEFIHTDNSGSSPFFGTVRSATSPGLFAGKNISGAIDQNRPIDSNSLSFILNSGLRNCNNGSSCALKLLLQDASIGPTSLPLIPVSFTLGTAIPDLNAIVIADGLSDNGTYHARTVELIPLTQSI